MKEVEHKMEEQFDTNELNAREDSIIESNIFLQYLKYVEQQQDGPLPQPQVASTPLYTFSAMIPLSSGATTEQTKQHHHHKCIAVTQPHAQAESSSDKSTLQGEADFDEELVQYVKEHRIIWYTGGRGYKDTLKIAQKMNKNGKFICPVNLIIPFTL